MKIYSITEIYVNGEKSREHQLSKVFASLEDAVAAVNSIVNEMKEGIEKNVFVSAPHYPTICKSRTAQEAYMIRLISRRKFDNYNKWVVFEHEL